MLLHGKRHWVAVLMLCVMVAACVTYRTVQVDRGIGFNHAKHPEKMACTDCHAEGDKGEPGMPSHDVCGTCHDQADVDKSKDCKYCHTNPEQNITPRKKVLSDEIIFAHAKHAEKGVECEKCHVGPDPLSFLSKPLMPVCMDCHEKTKPELAQCSVCHKEISDKTPPKYRGPVRIQHDAPAIWETVHGQQSKLDPKFCELCHKEANFCEDCHRKNPPKNHTLVWRKKSHGLRAEWDREKCSVCHEEDSCIRCHKNNEPSSHHGGWGAPGNRHCVSCHYPAQENNCTVCHESVDHEKAPPSPHDMGIYPAHCGTCHPFGNPYRAPHLVNSTVRCAVCH